MEPAVQAIFDDWSLPIYLTGSLVLTAAIYLRGWLLIRKTRPERFPLWRLVSFELGLTVIWLAIGSPMDGFADALLSAHMVEHLMLMSFVPPLLLLGSPVVPMLRGLPRWFLRFVVGPIYRQRPVRGFFHWLVTPIVAWLLMNGTFLAWHIPAAYDFALENEFWHDIEHICFVLTSILFWWPLVRPWPSRLKSMGWFMLPYLALADIVNTALSGFLAFCERPVYSYYLKEANPFGINPVVDQRAGAVVMWVVGSLVFLGPAMLITYRLLMQRQRSIQ